MCFFVVVFPFHLGLLCTVCRVFRGTLLRVLWEERGGPASSRQNCPKLMIHNGAAGGLWSQPISRCPLALWICTPGKNVSLGSRGPCGGFGEGDGGGGVFKKVNHAKFENVAL